MLIFCTVALGDMVLCFHANKIQLPRERRDERCREIKGETGRCRAEFPQMSLLFIYMWLKALQCKPETEVIPT